MQYNAVRRRAMFFRDQVNPVTNKGIDTFDRNRDDVIKAGVCSRLLYAQISYTESIC